MRVFLGTFKYILAGVVAAVLCSCSSNKVSGGSTCEYAYYFDIDEDAHGTLSVITIDPVSSVIDTLKVATPFNRIVCMSSSFVAALSAVGKDSVVVGVSALDYLSNDFVKGNAKEVGYEASPDYETIVSLNPDLVVAYSVGGSTPTYVTRLRDMGLRVLLVGDYLEEHPLARAEYVKLFGALTGRLDAAEEYFEKVATNYNQLVERTADSNPLKVLINIPYSDQWFIPGGDNYTSRLVTDAGGKILGSKLGQSESSVISLEEAFMLSAEADSGLHPGWCESIDDI
ncbi:MAG: ABC transporter substrate-binding protein [Bacteroidales bacterium]|nr:ABC transporter substrate-binding protein [Bacteroidales bacterium]